MPSAWPAFAVMGAAKGLTVTGSAPVAIVMGMLTATFGGVLRDLLASERSVLLTREIYVTAALAGAAVYTVLEIAGLPMYASATLVFLVAFGIRGGALRYGLQPAGTTETCRADVPNTYPKQPLSHRDRRRCSCGPPSWPHRAGTFVHVIADARAPCAVRRRRC